MTNISDLTNAIVNELRDYTRGVNVLTNQLAYNSGKEAARLLRRSYSTRRTGNYNSGWKVSRRGGQVRVYNSKAGYLTHILENGHVIRRNGSIVGEVRPIPHISLVNENIIAKFEAELRKEVEALRNR